MLEKPKTVFSFRLILGYHSLDPYACSAPDHHRYINVSWLQTGFEWLQDKVMLILKGQKRIILWVHIPCSTQILMSSLRHRTVITFSFGEIKLISAQSGDTMLGLQF